MNIQFVQALLDPFQSGLQSLAGKGVGPVTLQQGCDLGARLLRESFHVRLPEILPATVFFVAMLLPRFDEN